MAVCILYFTIKLASQLLVHFFLLLIRLPKCALLPNQLFPDLFLLLNVLIYVANVLHSQFDLMLHPEVHPLGSVIVMRHLILSHLLHLTLHDVLDILISLLLVGV